MSYFAFLRFSDDFIRACLELKRYRFCAASVLSRQIYFTGVQSLPYVLLLALVLGVFITLQGEAYLSAIGQREWLYQILISALIRDLGPLILCLFVLARSGTAMTTELGNMKVKGELDCLRILGISPMTYLVVPRVIAMLVSLCLLIVYFALVGIGIGAVIILEIKQLPVMRFLEQFLIHLMPSHLLCMFAKVAVAGVGISLIACYQGMRAEASSTDIPRRNIRAVSLGVLFVLASHLMITLYYVYA